MFTYKYKITSEHDGNHMLHVKRSDGLEAKRWWGMRAPTQTDFKSFNYRDRDYWNGSGYQVKW